MDAPNTEVAGSGWAGQACELRRIFTFLNTVVEKSQKKNNVLYSITFACQCP